MHRYPDLTMNVMVKSRDVGITPKRGTILSDVMHVSSPDSCLRKAADDFVCDDLGTPIARCVDTADMSANKLVLIVTDIRQLFFQE